jgi:hypothetical protein
MSSVVEIGVAMPVTAVALVTGVMAFRRALADGTRPGMATFPGFGGFGAVMINAGLLTEVLGMPEIKPNGSHILWGVFCVLFSALVSYGAYIATGEKDPATGQVIRKPSMRAALTGTAFTTAMAVAYSVAHFFG